MDVNLESLPSRKKFKVVVKLRKTEEIVDIIYMEARAKGRAERVAIVLAGDYWGVNTGELTATAERTKKTVYFGSFKLLVGMLKDDLEDAKEIEMPS